MKKSHSQNILFSKNFGSPLKVNFNWKVIKYNSICNCYALNSALMIYKLKKKSLSVNKITLELYTHTTYIHVLAT